MYDVTMIAYRAKMAQAVGSGTPVPRIATVLVGSAGVDAQGNPLVPTNNESGVYQQVLSKAPKSVTYPTTTSVQITVEVLPTDLPAGTAINEIGLVDSTGTFAEHTTFYTKNTDGTTTMELSATMQL